HLEGQGAEGGAVLGGTGHHLVGAGDVTGHRRHLGGGGQVVADGVEQRLDSLVAQGRAGQHRHHRAGHGGLADGRLERGGGDRLPLEVRGGQGVVEVGGGLDQLLAGGGHLGGHLGGDGLLARRVGLL